jgi:hypothetical protein
VCPPNDRPIRIDSAQIDRTTRSADARHRSRKRAANDWEQMQFKTTHVSNRFATERNAHQVVRLDRANDRRDRFEFADAMAIF